MEGENRAGENSCVRYIRQIGPNLYHIFGPSSGTLVQFQKNSYGQSTYYGGVKVQIEAF